MSILQSEKKCFLSGDTRNLHKHHIYYGANRHISEEEGFWVWVSAHLHTGSSQSIHQNPNKGYDLYLKILCQREYEKGHTREDFIKLIGRSYL